ncbi:MAG: tRNA preQ1(34) S-adenosylmethionine ribosyltransferase-isomerase QueA [Bdellovibrionales bacterium]
MQTSDLDYLFPAELIATEPSRPCRVAFMMPGALPKEMNLNGLIAEFKAGDLLVINESKVIPARVFSADEIEVLFLRALDPEHWQVLFPAREFAVGDSLTLPHGLTITLTQKGLPQVVRVSKSIDGEYFNRAGEVALPPYIQEARGQRHNRAEDVKWYQTEWAKNPGSVAAPTASLHFQQSDLNNLRERGVEIAKITLHVGAGTFFPVKAQDLTQHVMHEEFSEIPAETLKLIQKTKTSGGRVWALGTTVARTLESQAAGILHERPDGSFQGATKLFIYPPYEFKVCDALLTNFHQPKSTLFGLVAAFAGLETAKSTYAWAIERKFRLFSYGDLSAWIKP